MDPHTDIRPIDDSPHTPDPRHAPDAPKKAQQQQGSAEENHCPQKGPLTPWDAVYSSKALGIDAPKTQPGEDADQQSLTNKGSPRGRTQAHAHTTNHHTDAAHHHTNTTPSDDYYPPPLLLDN